MMKQCVTTTNKNKYQSHGPRIFLNMATVAETSGVPQRGLLVIMLRPQYSAVCWDCCQEKLAEQRALEEELKTYTKDGLSEAQGRTPPDERRCLQVHQNTLLLPMMIDACRPLKVVIRPGFWKHS